jgi:hypothetical protein
MSISALCKFLRLYLRLKVRGIPVIRKLVVWILSQLLVQRAPCKCQGFHNSVLIKKKQRNCNRRWWGRWSKINAEDSKYRMLIKFFTAVNISIAVFRVKISYTRFFRSAGNHFYDCMVSRPRTSQSKRKFISHQHNAERTYDKKIANKSIWIVTQF